MACADGEARPAAPADPIAARIASLTQAPGLLGHYPLDGDARDESGFANDGVVAGALPAPDRFGNAAGALAFDGQAHIRIPSLQHAPSLFTSAFSISFWHRAQVDRRMYAFSVDGDGCSSQNLNLELHDQVGHWAYWNSQGANAIRSGTIAQYTDGGWHHVLLRRTGGMLELLIDGQPVGSAAVGVSEIGSNQRDLYLGVNPCFGAAPNQRHGFQGELDDLAIYGRALSDSEALALARNGLVGSYAFDPDMSDASGFANTATATGVASAADRHGNPASAYALDGQAEIRIPRLQHAATLFDDSFTIAFWAQSARSQQASLFVVDAGCSDANLEIELDGGGAGSAVYWNGSQGPRMVGGREGEFTDDRWRHFALRRDLESGGVELFVDGVLTASANDSGSVTLGSNAADLVFGRDPCAPAGSSGFAGALDDVQIHTRALNDQELALLAADGLVASYRFEGGGVDDSGHDNPAIVVGGYQVTGHDGAAQSAFQLFGAQYIEVPPLAHAPQLYSGAFTISFWQRSKVRNRMYALDIDPVDGTRDNLAIEVNDASGIWAYWNSGGVNRVRDGWVGQLADDAWHHIVLRRSAGPGGSMQLYVDGAPRGEVELPAGTIGSNTARLYLGGRMLRGKLDYGFQGALDDLSIFNRALSPAELSRLRTGGRLRLLSPAPGASWAAGSKHYITWTGRPVGDQSVEVELSVDGGSWTRLGSATNGRLLWTVPEQSSTRARVRIRALAEPTMSDETRADFTIAPSQRVEDYSWKLLTNEAPYTPRDGAGALVHDGRMFLIGGWRPPGASRTNNEVWSSRDGVLWEPVALANPWDRRHTAGWVLYDDRMWIVGGDANSGYYQNDVWRSLDNGSSWEAMMPAETVPGWAQRALHQATAFAGRMWLFGGQKMAGLLSSLPPDEALYGDAWSSANGVDWLPEAEGNAWAPRGMIGGSAQLHGQLWLLGGGTYSTPRHPKRTFHQDVWSSSDGVSWRRVLERAPWDARQYHDVITFDDRMWVVGGYGESNGNLNDVWYSADGVNWYEVPNTPWQPRHAVSLFDFDGGLIMAGGIGDAIDTRDREVWKLARPAVE